MNIFYQHRYVVLFTCIYIIGWSGYFLYQKDFEFLWYVAVLVICAGLVAGTLHRTRFDRVILWGLSLWGLLHMAGGSIPVGDTVLYGALLIPLFDGGGEFVLLKYDQAVHMYGFAVATLVSYHIIRPHISRGARIGAVVFIAVLAGMGLGVINEMVEFTAVMTFPETGVGGYVNTSLDLVFNTFGACLAGVYILWRREKNVYSSVASAHEE